MITLNASGGSITFEFSGNSTYLNDGTITVPVNSLALIIDESDMATFRKAASNDIFVSANIAEFGMTKAELESWFKANAVGSTGGGGGVTSGEVQTMIDESISGKADSSAVTEEISAAVSGKANSSDVYTTGQTSGATEIANALNAKLDATAYTPTDLSEYWTSAQTSSAIDEATSGKTNQSEFTAYTASTDAALSGKADSSAVTEEISAAVSGKVDTTTYTAYTADTTPKVNVAWQQGIKAPSLGYNTISGITLSSLPISGGDYNYSSIATDDSLKSDDESVLGVYATGDTHVVSINPTEKINTAHLRVDKKPFNIKMYWNSSYTGNTSHNIAVNCVVNDGTNGYCQWNWDGSQYTPRSDYNNTAVTLSYDSTNQVVTITPSSSSALDYIRYVKCNRYIAPSSALTQDDCRIGLVTIDSNLYKLQEALDNKVDTSAIATSITSGDTNPVAGGAVYDKVHVTSGNGSTTLLTFATAPQDFWFLATNYPSGVTKFNIEFDLTADWGQSNSTNLYFKDSSNNEYAMGIVNTNGVLSYQDNSSMFGTSLTATTSQTDNVLTIEITGLSGGAPSSLTEFGKTDYTGNILLNAYAVEGETAEYWIKDYVDAKVAEAGGGKAIEAGRGISVTTGETADTVSFSLPISAGTGTNSIKCGGNCIATKTNSAAFGNNSQANGQNSFAINQAKANAQDSFSQGISYAEKSFSAALGRLNYSKNDSELSCGQFNNSVSATTTFGDSGNTLFSVGNGTANNARHNAFEVRQNGDIYLTLDGQDVKLQDQLGGSSYTAGDGIDITNDVISVTGMVATSAVTSAVTSGDTNPVQNQALWNELRISNGGETETTLRFEIGGGDSANYPEGCTKIKVEVIGSMNESNIYFFNDGQDLGEIEILNNDNISVYNNFGGATYEISGTTVIISYPTITNVTKIQVNTHDSNYIYKAVTTEPPTAVKDQVVANTTALGGLKLQQISQSDYDNLPTKDSSTLYIII